ncbi:MAG: C4-type zinc ribbon domain-containing protein [Clostridia bacterium]|nr:C4-type zinc ribbon domain-containing protein [Clostridia bacterium]
MNIDKILEYQKKDLEIVKLTHTLVDSPNRKAINQILNIVKETQYASSALESEAEGVLVQFNNLKKTYDDNVNSFITLTKKSVENISESEMSGVMNLINVMSSNLNILEKKLLGLAEKVNSILSNYEEAKKKYEMARKKHSEIKTKYEKEKSLLQPKIAAFEAELKAMEKSVDVKLLTKYKEKRQDKIFPIFVKFSSDACGGCRMELPYAQIEKLKKEGIIECENCHRYMFMP